MSHLFVANGTHQHQQFMYRVLGVNYSKDEYRPPRRLEIPAGRQQKFPEDFTEDQLEDVIKQLEQYGAVPVSDLHVLHPRALVYKVDRKPIEADEIDEARSQDEEARQEVSAQQLENAGLAQFASVASRDNGHLQSTSLEVTQLNDVDDKAAKNGVDVEVNVSPKNTGKSSTERRKRN